MTDAVGSVVAAAAEQLSSWVAAVLTSPWAPVPFAGAITAAVIMVVMRYIRRRRARPPAPGPSTAVSRPRVDWLDDAGADGPDLREVVIRTAADAALAEMLTGNVAGAQLILETVSELGDPMPILRAVILRWCDAGLDAMGVTEQHTAQLQTGGMHLSLGFGYLRQSDHTCRDVELDEVPADAAWAGRMLAARAAEDRDTGLALFATTGPGEIAARAVATLQLVCATIRTGQRVLQPDTGSSR